jgi:hypothetical protein
MRIHQVSAGIILICFCRPLPGAAPLDVRGFGARGAGIAKDTASIQNKVGGLHHRYERRTA